MVGFLQMVTLNFCSSKSATTFKKTKAVNLKPLVQAPELQPACCVIWRLGQCGAGFGLGLDGNRFRVYRVSGVGPNLIASESGLKVD